MGKFCHFGCTHTQQEIERIEDGNGKLNFHTYQFHFFFIPLIPTLGLSLSENNTPMIFYNVTVKVMHDIAEKWLHWLQNEHINDVLGTGKFVSAQVCKLLEQDETDGISFVVQYKSESWEQYQKYIEEDSALMRQKGYDKFGDRFIAFRTVMEAL